jgi:hypothetical protein
VQSVLVVRRLVVQSEEKKADEAELNHLLFIVKVIFYNRDAL